MLKKITGTSGSKGTSGTGCAGSGHQNSNGKLSYENLPFEFWIAAGEHGLVPG